MSIKVECIVECVEVDGKEPGVGTHPRPCITVRSHWNRSNLIVLVIGDKTYTLASHEMAAAVTNATNRGALT